MHILKCCKNLVFIVKYKNNTNREGKLMLASIKAVNLLLYLKYDCFEKKSHEGNSILCFNNKKIFAVDEFMYNKEQRCNLQKQLCIRPYYINQRIFHSLLRASCKLGTNILIRNIVFIDDSIKDEPEYELLENLIHKESYEKVYDITINLLKEYDTEIKNIKINFRGYDFKLTNKGVIETFAPQSTITSLSNDKVFNKIILGIG